MDWTHKGQPGEVLITPGPFFFSPLFQRYMLTVRVNVPPIMERSIPGCQDVGVSHRGQM